MKGSVGTRESRRRGEPRAAGSRGPSSLDARVRSALVVLWLGGFAACIAESFYLNGGGWIEDDNFQLLAAEVSKLYAVYLGSILAFVFTPATRARPARTKSPLTPAVVAILVSLGWNLLIVLSVAAPFFGWMGVESVIRRLSFVGATLSWLVAPAVAYYFAQRAAGERT